MDPRRTPATTEPRTRPRVAAARAIGALALLLSLGAAACRNSAPPLPSVDPHSFSRPAEVRVQHMELDLAVDFDARTLRGSALLRLRRSPGFDELVLDTRDLEIRGVHGEPDGETLPYELGQERPFLGRPLVIRLEGATDAVRVDYTTSPEAGGLLWLEPRQTAAGRQPFLLTQSQSILARTWVPCQDTPAVRTTYDATVRVPPGSMAVMSAENPTELQPDGVYTFRMPQAIPSYLLALAVGEIAFRPLGDRTGVYAEPPLLERAAWELQDTERMMAAAEELYGPYRWGRFDIIILPPSFPFGGMENPRLTFASPTIIAGDRSLVSLVAHELAHSWSGNLVTNATWNDLWLNEGFTTYFELRIMEELAGREYAEMLAQLGVQNLREAIDELGPEHPDTRLHVDLAGRDPDVGFSDVPYEKGYLFLRMMEERLGRERWDGFLAAYFDAHAFGSMSSAGFEDYCERELEDEEPGLAALLHEWIEAPGWPENTPVVRSSAFEKVDAEMARWIAGADPASLDVGSWSTHEWVHFVRNLPADLGSRRMGELDAAFGLTGRGNAEVLAAWLLQSIEQGYDPGRREAERFLTRVGRSKFIRPLYEALARTPEGRARARKIFERARPGYHPVAVTEIEGVLAAAGS
jgi:aminopeptidase N